MRLKGLDGAWCPIIILFLLGSCQSGGHRRAAALIASDAGQGLEAMVISDMSPLYPLRPGAGDLGIDSSGRLYSATEDASLLILDGDARAPVGTSSWLRVESCRVLGFSRGLGPSGVFWRDREGNIGYAPDLAVFRASEDSWPKRELGLLEPPTKYQAPASRSCFLCLDQGFALVWMARFNTAWQLNYRRISPADGSMGFLSRSFSYKDSRLLAAQPSIDSRLIYLVVQEAKAYYLLAMDALLWTEAWRLEIGLKDCPQPRSLGLGEGLIYIGGLDSLVALELDAMGRPRAEPRIGRLAFFPSRTLVGRDALTDPFTPGLSGESLSLMGFTPGLGTSLHGLFQTRLGYCDADFWFGPDSRVSGQGGGFLDISPARRIELGPARSLALPPPFSLIKGYGARCYAAAMGYLWKVDSSGLASCWQLPAPHILGLGLCKDGALLVLDSAERMWLGLPDRGGLSMLEGRYPGSLLLSGSDPLRFGLLGQEGNGYRLWGLTQLSQDGPASQGSPGPLLCELGFLGLSRDGLEAACLGPKDSCVAAVSGRLIEYRRQAQTGYRGIELATYQGRALAIWRSEASCFLATQDGKILATELGKTSLSHCLLSLDGGQWDRADFGQDDTGVYLYAWEKGARLLRYGPLMAR